MSNLLRKNHLVLETTLFTCQVHILIRHKTINWHNFLLCPLKRYPSFFSSKTLFLELKGFALMILNNRTFALRGHVTSF